MFDRIDSLEGLIEVKLQGLYDAEKQFVKALPKMAANAGAEAFRDDLWQVRYH